MAKTSPFKFLQEVRTETAKVTWPTRRETMITTAMVFVMVALASVFFLVADWIIRFVVSLLLDVQGWQAYFEAHFWGLNPILALAIVAGLLLLAFCAWSLKRTR